MNRIAPLLIAVLLLLNAIFLGAQVAINSDGAPPNPSAMLDVKSSIKGFLPPRMTTAEREAISNPVEGLVIYNTDSKTLQVFDGTLWSSPNAEFACGYQILDADSNIYNTIRIGNQCWITENLGTTKYNDGTAIPHVTGNSAWDALTTPAYCWYNNNKATYGTTYGALYNWYTVNTGNLCPNGWHVPTDDEWKTMEIYLGMTQAQADGEGNRGTDEGGKLKETGTSHWQTPNTGATNSSGFIALPGGFRYLGGYFGNLGSTGTWWTATESLNMDVWSRTLSYDYEGVYRYYGIKGDGFSIRCLRD